MKVQPYLFFEGRCEEALEFYKRALGAEVTMLLRFKDNPEPQATSAEGCTTPPEVENKIMHSSFHIGESDIMASDGRCSGQAAHQGFSLSITADNEAEADRLFNNLSEGGQIQMPLNKTFFSPKFGMVADRFGVSWMVIVAH